MEKCQHIEETFAAEYSERASPRRQALRSAWQTNYCDDFTTGNQLAKTRTNLLVFDIGFHSGDDTLHFLKLGHDVVAIDANPAMIRAGFSRPAVRLAAQTGRLHAIAKGVVRSKTHANQSLTFFLHRTITEWSTFIPPRPRNRHEFDSIVVPVTTCADLIRQFGTPHYMKVDIEGYDKECLASLEVGRLPTYVSTEDPLQLDYLLSLGYRSFKMVSQRLTRRGSHQFSGGMPDEAPGVWGGATSVREHPFFSTTHMHVRIDQHGNRIREEHDLHACLALRHHENP